MEDRFCTRHKYLETKWLQEKLDGCTEKFNFFRHPCELCNERGHLNLQCKLFHGRIVSKSCDGLISLAHHNEFSLLLGYEEMKCITKNIPYNPKRFLDFDLEEIYMFCAVNFIENPYIANYLKTRRKIEYEESTNERENISQYPPSVSYDESGDEEELPIQSISSTSSSKKLIKPTREVVKKKKKRRKSRGKKVTLPSNIAPITVVPHEVN